MARRLTANGRSRAFVWGRGCARADLEAHRRAAHRDVVPARGPPAGAPGAPARAARRARRHGRPRGRDGGGLARPSRCGQAAFESARGEAADAARRRLDLEDLVARVDQLAPAAGEPDALRAERERLRHLDELAAAAGAAAELLSPADGQGARELTASAAQEVAGVTAFAPELADVAAALDEIAAPHPGRVRRPPRPPGRARGRPGPARARRGPPRGLRPARAPVRGAARARWSSRRAPPAGRWSGSRARPRSSPGSRPRPRRPPRRLGTCAARLTTARAAAAEPFARAVEAELADLGMAAGRLHGPGRAGRHRPEGRRPRRARAGGNPDACGRAGGRDGLGRRALAHRACDPGRGASRRRAGDPAPRRGRRRHRRPHRPGRGRQAGRARRGRPAPRHHPPAPDRRAPPTRTSCVEKPEDAERGDRRAAGRGARWWRSWRGCWAATRTTRPRAGTPRRCGRSASELGRRPARMTRDHRHSSPHPGDGLVRR